MRRQPQFTRAERLQHLMLDEVTRIVGGELRSPIATHVLVTAVRLAGDLAHLRVRYVLEGSEEPSAKAAEVLERSAAFVARSLARGLQLRRVPKVVFTFDDEYIRLRRIRDLLAKDRPADDPPGEADGPDAAGSDSDEPA